MKKLRIKKPKTVTNNLSDKIVVGGYTKPKFGKKHLVVLSLGVLAVAILVGAFFVTKPNSTSTNQQGNSTDAAVSSEPTGPDLNQEVKSLQESDPENWSREDVDSAYENLIYADSVGAFSQAQEILYNLEVARSAGVDIDQNSKGIDEAKRSEIRQRADNLEQAQLQGGQ